MDTKFLDTLTWGQIKDLQATLKEDLAKGTYQPSKKKELEDKIQFIKSYLQFSPRFA